MSDFQLGSRCALLLPKGFVWRQKVPAKGLVTNIFLDCSRLVLVEEVWGFLGSNLTVGWYPCPALLPKEKFIMVPAKQENLLECKDEALGALINIAVEDYYTTA
jgi:hypothetical protein